MGKTYEEKHAHNRAWKHPHVHGEDLIFVSQEGEQLETPPRAWGRLFTVASCPAPRRNTPTCMGKTVSGWLLYPANKKHPHVHGEDRSKLHKDK